ncbi:MAG TPA: protein-L-isoaspartate(D-aspartate) O-methyltransferase [Mesorhizobium sp.]|jgi:protein-L-isoaspartate(D-aspartate) O-methyltransferase|nr:protein-L-isoaspartate(D-aspartate) O-methyltransferase [Mesorhizobium sp.]
MRHDTVDAQAQARARADMVERQIFCRGIRDPAVLKAMGTVPREFFVPDENAALAYRDGPLPISEGQTISQPFVVALMAEAAKLSRRSRVLEVGAGSGFAAAVLSRIAAEVFAIERHAALTEQARRRLEALGFDNVTLHTGDGTEGWPEQAPFDAIIVSAGGPEVPDALKRQLAVGGRLVIPVGPEQNRQTLLRVTRIGEEEFAQEDLGRVAFVPLVGRHGWPEDIWAQASGAAAVPLRRPQSLPEMIAQAAEPLPPIDDPGFARFIDRFASRRVVLLGEATHGTSEFYRARAAITRRLVERHGFRIVAAEADWPDAAAVNRRIRRRPDPAGAPPPFQRFPLWMWRNREAAALFSALREFNDGRPEGDQVGFYGLDIYNMSASISAVLTYLQGVDPEAAKHAHERYGCLTPWRKDPAHYGRAVLSFGYETCEDKAVEQCRELLEKAFDYARETGGESFLDAAQNARLVASAERYYRTMYRGGAESWNLRDTHMFETLGHLIDAKGENARAVVWAHNSHIGDARFTEMGFRQGELNLGQLCRERWGNDAALIGFGTHSGTVAAADDWDEPMKVKQVKPSHGQSYERLFHDSGVASCVLDFEMDGSRAVREKLLERRIERFIGVIYRPETEMRSHYAEASLPRQFDAFAWFDQTSAVTPLPGAEKGGVPDTFPFGV